MLVFEEKDCPFCDGFGDNRDNTFRKKCNHGFTELEYGAVIASIYELEATIKENKKIIKQMKSIIEKRNKKELKGIKRY